MREKRELIEPVQNMIIMVLSIQTKKGRNIRCISLQYNKEGTIEKEKDIR